MIGKGARLLSAMAAHLAVRPFCQWVCLRRCGQKGSWHRGWQLHSQRTVCLSDQPTSPSEHNHPVMSEPSFAMATSHDSTERARIFMLCVCMRALHACLCQYCLIHVIAKNLVKHIINHVSSYFFLAKVITCIGQKMTERFACKCFKWTQSKADFGESASYQQWRKKRKTDRANFKLAFF